MKMILPQCHKGLIFNWLLGKYDSTSLTSGHRIEQVNLIMIKILLKINIKYLYLIKVEDKLEF